MFCSSHTSSPHFVTKIHNPIIQLNMRGLPSLLKVKLVWVQICPAGCQRQGREEICWRDEVVVNGRVIDSEGVHMWGVRGDPYCDPISLTVSPVWPLSSSGIYCFICLVSTGSHHTTSHTRYLSQSFRTKIFEEKFPHSVCLIGELESMES